MSSSSSASSLPPSSDPPPMEEKQEDALPSLAEQLIFLKRVEAFVLNLRRRVVLAFLSFQILQDPEKEEPYTQLLVTHSHETLLTAQSFLLHLHLPVYKPSMVTAWDIEETDKQGYHPSGPTFEQWFRTQIHTHWAFVYAKDMDEDVKAFMEDGRGWNTFWTEVFLFIGGLVGAPPPQELLPFQSFSSDSPSSHETNPYLSFWKQYWEIPRVRMMECFSESTLHLASDRDRSQWIQQLRHTAFTDVAKQMPVKKVQRYLHDLSHIHTQAIDWHFKAYKTWLAKYRGLDTLEGASHGSYDSFIEVLEPTFPRLREINKTLYLERLQKCTPGTTFPNAEACLAGCLYAYTLEFWVTAHDTLFEAVDAAQLEDTCVPSWFRGQWLVRFKKFHMACMSMVLDKRAPTDKFLHPLHFPAYQAKSARLVMVEKWWVPDTPSDIPASTKRPLSSSSSSTPSPSMELKHPKIVPVQN